MRATLRRTIALQRRLAWCLTLLLTACATSGAPRATEHGAPVPRPAEHIRVLDVYPGVTASIVTPADLDATKPVELILYALPNGNSTLETMGRTMSDGVGWRFDIQHIAAQTRALRDRGVPQAVVAYIEADGKSWPAWRAKLGYPRANRRIIEIVDQLRTTIGDPPRLSVTLTGHSGGGSFMFGFIEGQDALPGWLTRIVFLDANYNYSAVHGEKLRAWLRADTSHRLGTLAYDDREITLDGKKVVSETGGTWRATQRLLDDFSAAGVTWRRDTLNAFVRYRVPQVEVLLHPNPENKILHTAMIGEMNGYLHALLHGRRAYDRGPSLLRTERAYAAYVEGAVALPPPAPPAIPPRAADALSGSAFIATIAHANKEPREAATLREILAGNIPSFLRSLQTVEARITGADGAIHTVQYAVMPDYLAIGSDSDFVRMPMTPYTAQAFCDFYGFVLPTRKMSDDIWTAARVRGEPRPLTRDRDSTLTFLEHHRIIEAQLAGTRRGDVVAGIKKDVVVSNALRVRAERVAIYGWHYLNGQPIQPVYAGHVDWYIDYSHGIRPVRRLMRVDGAPMTFEAILADSTKRALLSDEGTLGVTRYERP
ncbi:MAG: hypothetical protein FJ363_04080 [Gemmatimonadetes bacterium]|nr:hypothetical protein [Gemmatimonadota bacterium]